MRSESLTGSGRCLTTIDRRVLLIGGASLVLALSLSAHAEVALIFPKIVGMSLAGEAVRLPDDLPGSKTVVLVSQRREHTEARVAWGDQLGPRSVIPVADLALFDDYGSVFRGMVRNALNDGIENPVARAQVVMVFGGRKELAAKLGIVSDSDVHALVVERVSGLIVGHETGHPTTASLARIVGAMRSESHE